MKVGIKCGTLAVALSVIIITTVSAEDWPRFRGPNGSGISSSSSAPMSWSDSENIKWKIELPGPGASSPIVYGDKVLVTCYTGFGLDKEEPGQAADLKRHLCCYDKADGSLMWLGSALHT